MQEDAGKTDQAADDDDAESAVSSASSDGTSQLVAIIEAVKQQRGKGVEKSNEPLKAKEKTFEPLPQQVPCLVVYRALLSCCLRSWM